MNQPLLTILAFLTFFNASSQDLGVVTSSSPVSGCVLDTAEVVEVFIINFGPDVFTSFDVSYSINGGTPITETIPAATFLSLNSYSYTFDSVADLSAPGIYNLCYYTTVAGETNNSNDTICVTVVNDALTIPGTTQSDQTVCLGINTGTINLTGNLGSVQSWQTSETSGASWVNVVNTLASQPFTNIITETWYRAVSKNGLCPVDTSSTTIISIDLPSVGGNLSGPDTVCLGINSGLISLTGEFGLVSSWEFSDDGGSNWQTISNTTNSYSFTNLSTTTLFRVEVVNGTCSLEYSDTLTVNVVPGAVGGTLSSGSSSVCINENNQLITLSGSSGVIDHWESSIDGGSNWTNITNITTSYTTSNISVETLYRVILLGCINDTSSVLVLTIDPLSVGGIASGDTTVCSSQNNGGIFLTGETGIILDWEYSEDNGTTWQSSGSGASAFNFSNITSEAIYQAIVQSGSCPSDTSNSVTINLFPNNSGVGPDTTINEGDVANLYAFGGSFYSWSPSSDLDDASSSSPIASPLSTTTYTVDITDSNTCVFVDSVVVTVVSDGIEISNLITANGDGFNDNWVIKGLEDYSDISVKIINKKGVVVYFSDNYSNDWKGRFKGNYLPTGTYYYIIEHPEINVITGHLNILSND